MTRQHSPHTRSQVFAFFLATSKGYKYQLYDLGGKHLLRYRVCVCVCVWPIVFSLCPSLDVSSHPAANVLLHSHPVLCARAGARAHARRVHVASRSTETTARGDHPTTTTILSTFVLLPWSQFQCDRHAALQPVLLWSTQITLLVVVVVVVLSMIITSKFTFTLSISLSLPAAGSSMITQL